MAKASNWQTGYYRYKRYFTSLSRFYQERKARTYAGIVFSLLAIIFFLVFAIKPTLVTIAGLTKQLDDHKLVAQKMQEKINSLSRAQQEYQTIRENLYLIDEALPKESQVSTLIKQIEALASRSDTTLQTVKIDKTSLAQNPSSPKTTSEEPNPPALAADNQAGGSQEKKLEEEKPKAEQSIQITLSLSGRYLSLKEFLRSLSSLRRIITVQSFGFKADKNKPENLTLTLKAKAFYLSQ